MSENKNITWGASSSEWDHFDLILGLTDDLLPVVSNPNASISEASKMADIGKTPSKYNREGLVAGVKGWTAYVATAKDVEQWSKCGDYGICLQTRAIRAIDVDVADEDKAQRIQDFIENTFGALPMRYRSNSGKFLVAFNMPGEFTKRRFEVDGGVVEFLATGQQFVAVGTHPSGVRYEWVGGLPMSFPTLSSERFESGFSAMVDTFAVGDVAVRGGVASIDRSIRVEGVTDPVVAVLRERKMIKSIHNDGRINIVCPWEHEHSEGGGAESSTQYNPAGVGRSDPGFKCLHAHCDHRNVADFYEALGYEVDVSEEFEALIHVDEGSGEQQPAPLPPLDRTDDGKIKSTISNLAIIMKRDDVIKCRIAFDSFKDEIMLSTDRGINWRAFRDADYVRLRLILERRGFQSIAAEKMRDVVTMIADEVKFDSAKLWLDRLEWDGVPRVDGFLETYFSTTDDDADYVRAVSRYIWTALAGRIIEPGVKADIVPILVGEQGARKSTAVSKLCPSPEFFTEITFADKDDDNARKLRGKMVVEIGELRGLHTKELESIKAFITRQHEHHVPKFKEFTSSFARRCVMIGTTNRDEFLADATGNRRFAPVRVGRVDTDGIERDRLQLWAEGAIMFAMNGILWQDVERMATEKHDDHKMSDSWETVVFDWLFSEDFGVAPMAKGYVTTSEVLTDCLKISVGNINRGHQMRLADVMKSVGFEKRKIRDGKSTSWHWFKK